MQLLLQYILSILIRAQDDRVINLSRQSRDYYEQFTEKVLVGTDAAVETLGQCYVKINGEDVEGVVGSIFSEPVGADVIILCYMVYGKGSNDGDVVLLGYFSSGRVTVRYGGWELPDDANINALADDMRQSPQFYPVQDDRANNSVADQGDGPGVAVEKGDAYAVAAAVVFEYTHACAR